MLQRGPIVALLTEYAFVNERFIRIAEDALQKDAIKPEVSEVVKHVMEAAEVYLDCVSKMVFTSFDKPTGGLWSERLRFHVEALEASCSGLRCATDEHVSSIRTKTPWGGTYDLEQLIEHAIVHLLRHSRQVLLLAEMSD